MKERPGTGRIECEKRFKVVVICFVFVLRCVCFFFFFERQEVQCGPQEFLGFVFLPARFDCTIKSSAVIKRSKCRNLLTPFFWRVFLKIYYFEKVLKKRLGLSSANIKENGWP
jgi:hypothetical protein